MSPGEPPGPVSKGKDNAVPGSTFVAGTPPGSAAIGPAAPFPRPQRLPKAGPGPQNPGSRVGRQCTPRPPLGLSAVRRHGDHDRNTVTWLPCRSQERRVCRGSRKVWGAPSLHSHQCRSAPIHPGVHTPATPGCARGRTQRHAARPGLSLTGRPQTPDPGAHPRGNGTRLQDEATRSTDVRADSWRFTSLSALWVHPWKGGSRAHHARAAPSLASLVLELEHVAYTLSLRFYVQGTIKICLLHERVNKMRRVWHPWECPLGGTLSRRICCTERVTDSLTHCSLLSLDTLGISELRTEHLSSSLDHLQLPLVLG